jgi:CRISPR-associated endonuclease/helicase Cas3
MDWISHDDRTLKEHLKGLKEVVDQILPEKEQNFYSQDKLRQSVYNLISYHDLAKSSIYFQLYLANALIIDETGHKYYSINVLKKYIGENRPYFEEWKLAPELKNHALFGAWMALACFDDDKRYDLNALLFSKVLKRHHGYLRDFTVQSMNPVDKIDNLKTIAHSIDFEKYDVLAKDMGLPFKYTDISEIFGGFGIRRINKVVRGLSSNKESAYFYKTLFLYSLLLSADKGDMMLMDRGLIRSKIKSDVIDKFKSKTLKTDLAINLLREDAYKIAVDKVKQSGDNHFFSITLPTGLGKTFTAYKIALQIKEKFCPDFRIVYCLPFTSIIDQNASIFKDILEAVGIDPKYIGIHHHLSSPDKTEESSFTYPEWEYFTEGWQNEITITTFVQLWESLFANHNSQLRKFHNLVNSVIILDEIQSIKPDLFPALEFVMEELAKHFGTKFIFVTATQPILLKDKVVELCEKESKSYFFEKINRTVLNTSLLEQSTLREEEIAQLILDKYEDSPCSTLVICNTIRYSQNIYEILSEELDKDILFYISAGIIPYSRKGLLEKEVKTRLKNNEPIILISTQVVEAGVDIDFDAVYRDFAPLSSINQAAGRCNRNAEKDTSSVYLFRSGKERIYDPTQLDITEKALSHFKTEIPENQFYELNQEFFKGIKTKIQDGSDISNELIRSILSLKFEDVGTNKDYRLIVENYKSHNFFIPINKEAEELWEQYQRLFEIEEYIKKKTAMKLLMPELMQYAVCIPDYIYSPAQTDQEKAIVYDESWLDFYDEIFGYKKPEDEADVEIF